MNKRLTKKDLQEGLLYLLVYPNKKVIYVGMEKQDIGKYSNSQTGTMITYRFFILEDKKDIFLSETMIPINIERIK